MCEGRSIQKRLPKFSSPVNSNYSLARSFSNLMFQGKTKSALQLLSDKGKGVLYIKDLIHSTNNTNDHPETVLNILTCLSHCTHQLMVSTILYYLILSSINVLTQVTSDQLLFEQMVYIPGPSGLDAHCCHCWRRMCISFKSASNDLCHSLVLLAKHLCTTFVDPKPSDWRDHK